jgi:hypothetical protein
MWKRLRSFAALPATERRLALRATGILALVRLALSLLSFARIRALADRLGRTPAAPADETFARAVRRAVDRGARTIPGSACLAQALTAELMLRRAGRPVRVSIGVAPDGQPLDAHAWTESAGIIVTGESDTLRDFRTLVEFGDDSLSGQRR